VAVLETTKPFLAEIRGASQREVADV